MEKILIQIKDNIIYFKKKNNLNSEQKNLINTNIIADNELIFSDDYIKNNKKIISIFLKELRSFAVTLYSNVIQALLNKGLYYVKK